MAEYKITEAASRVLAAIRLQGELDAAEIGRICGLKTHVVHYHLRDLQNRGIATRRFFLNY